MKTLTTKRSWGSRLKYAFTAGMFTLSYAISMIAPFMPVQTASAASTHEIICHRLGAGNGGFTVIEPDDTSAHIPKHIDYNTDGSIDAAHSDFLITIDTDADALAKCAELDPGVPHAPPAVTFTDPCGTINDKIGIPFSEYASYVYSGTTYTTAQSITPLTSSVTVNATPKTFSFTFNGVTYQFPYVLSAPTTWSHTFTNAPCATTAEAPTVLPQCGPNNDTVTIPANTATVTYGSTGWVNGSLTVTATPASGYVITGDSSWTFTDANVPCTGNITVVKNVDTNGDGVVDVSNATDWNWNTDGSDTTFPYATGSGSPQTVNTGTYTVKEQQKDGYTVTASSCTGEDAPNTPSTSLSVNVSKDESVVCTFTNTRDTGTLEVKKVLNPSTDPGKFNLQINGVTTGTGANVGNNGTTGATTLVTGKYSVGETAGTSTTLANYSTTYVCLEGNTQVASGSGTAVSDVEVKKGQHVVCTFTNERKTVNLLVEKDVVNFNGGTKTYADFHFQNNLGPLQTFVETTSPDGARTITVNVGDSFSITEPEANTMGYTTSYSGCTGTAAEGQSYTCKITNNDDKPSLTLVKTVTNNNGGTLAASAWTLTATGPKTLSGTTPVTSGNDFKAGTYVLGETGPLGYTGDPWNCVGGTQVGNTITLALGENATCTIDNNDNKPTLTLVKSVDNKWGGTAVAADWTLTATGPTSISGDGGAQSGVGFKAGVYVLSEATSASATHYTQSAWSCPGGSLVGDTLTIGLGENVTCTIYNSDQPATITGTKSVTNADMTWVTQGTNPASGWSVYLDQNQNGEWDVTEQKTTTDANGNYSFSNLVGNMTYYVKEVMNSLGAGWEQVSAPSPVNLAMGATSTGNNFANKAYGSLTVIKNVVDENGVLTEDAKGWTWNYNGYGEEDDEDLQASQANKVKVLAGTYTVSENEQPNYTNTATSCSGESSLAVTGSQSVVVSPGEDVVCTFTNTRNTANITVTKTVENDNGGTAKVADFTLKVNSTVVTSGAATSFKTGESYGISEVANVDGYEQTKLKCWVSSDPLKLALKIPFTLNYGEDVQCEVVNDDIAPELTVYKHVDNGFTNLTKDAEDFTMNVDGTNVSDKSFPGDEYGTTVTLNAGSYAVSEGEHDGYDMSKYGDCNTSIKLGETKECHIYNDAIEKPAILVEKSGPKQAYEGDTVTYTFVVTNPGNIPFPQVEVEDNIADDAVLDESGDENENGYLDPGEEWTYTAKYTIPEGQVEDVKNTVTACGYYGWMEEEDVNYSAYESRTEEQPEPTCSTDTHVLDVLHPSLTVEKTGPANVLLGTAATYTFTVKNTGDTPLDLTKVLDDLAGVGTYVSGDINEDELLDLKEVWVFTATYTPPAVGSVVNTVEVCAEDELEGVVCAKDDHTTIVYVPQVLSETTPPVLQDTGTSLTLAWIVSSILLGLAILTQLNVQRTQKWLAAMRAGFAQPFSAV